MTLFSSSYYADQQKIEEWFAEITSVAGCSPKADRSAVLRAIKATFEKLEELQRQVAVVAEANGYRYWGAYYTAATKAALKDAPSELFERCVAWCSVVPVAWCRGKGKPTYGACRKRLTKTQDVIRRFCEYIAKHSEEEGPEWVEEALDGLRLAFEKSEDADSFEQQCLEIIYDVPEPVDPETVWLDAAEQAETTLERARSLPPVLVNELLEQARQQQVVVNQQTATWYDASERADGHWFYYLLTACLEDETAPDPEKISRVAADARKAAECGKFYKPEMENKATKQLEPWWHDLTTLDQMTTAYNAYMQAAAVPHTTYDVVHDAVRNALGMEEPVEA